MLHLFLEQLLTNGEIVFKRPPSAPPQRDLESQRILEQTFKRYVLDLPGAPPRLDIKIAHRAANVVRWASWLTLSHDEEEDELQRLLLFEGTPRSAAQHFSADMCLRFLPRVHKRLRAGKPDDPVVGILEDILRRWPLSGVLCDIADPPVALTLHSDAAMQLYAERFMRNPKDNWKPDGKAAEFLELAEFYQR
ncbi:MAG: hypothetical protein ACYTDT_11225 [Planctomycetota bacterium]|jgi:hypothetical protein